MPWIVAIVQWIMIVSGVLTATMIYAAIAPEAALPSTSAAKPVSRVAIDLVMIGLFARTGRVLRVHRARIATRRRTEHGV